MCGWESLEFSEAKHWLGAGIHTVQWRVKASFRLRPFASPRELEIWWLSQPDLGVGLAGIRRQRQSSPTENGVLRVKINEEINCPHCLPFPNPPILHTTQISKASGLPQTLALSGKDKTSPESLQSQDIPLSGLQSNSYYLYGLKNLKLWI